MVRSPDWFWPAFWRSRPPPRSLMVEAASVVAVDMVEAASVVGVDMVEDTAEASAVDMVEASAVDMAEASAVADILAQGVCELGLLPASSAVTRLEAAYPL